MMQEVQKLLSERWIIRDKDSDMYFRLKDKYHEYSTFFKQKLGYNIIVNPLMIKAEKIPGSLVDYMGISEIKSPKGYIFLCMTLMFLEERDVGEQFVLSEVIEFVKNQYPTDEIIDWTIYSNRKLMIHVLRYFIDESMILVNDGSDSGFSESEDAVEILYENTGLSKYFMRRFSFDISDVNSCEDFSKLEYQQEDVDRGLIRRQRVYRRLLMEPVVYDSGDDDQDYLYIKNIRSVILNDVEKYLDGDFHLHKNGAMVMIKDTSSYTLPNRKNVSDIVIQMCTLLQKNLKTYKQNELDQIIVSMNQWDMMVQELKETYAIGWSKKYRDMSLTHLNQEICEMMHIFGMIKFLEHEMLILPMVGKISGDYPKEFWEKNNEQMGNK